MSDKNSSAGAMPAPPTAKEQFIADLYPAAVKVSQQTGMSKELILAQAALETGWGEKVLPGTHNLFNIKTSPDWHGPSKSFSVPEFVGGARVMVNAEFRVYASNEEALNDRVKFLQENPRYARSGLFDAGTRGNLEKGAAALQKAGYATDPKYAEQLAAVYNGPTMQKAIKMATMGSLAEASHRGNLLQDQAERTRLPHSQALQRGDEGKAVSELQAKLGKLGYTDVDGKPLKPDGSFGPNTQYAVKAFQNDNHLKEDGAAGPNTLKAIDAKLKEHALSSPSRQEPGIQDSSLFKQAKTVLQKIDAQFGRQPDQLTDNAAAAVAVAAQKAGLTRIDHIEVGGPDNSKLFAVQGKPGTAHSKVIDVPTVEAMHTPMAQSAKAFEDTRQAQQQAVQHQPQVTQPSQQQAAPSLSH